jgi:hypothetical protein
MRNISIAWHNDAHMDRLSSSAVACLTYHRLAYEAQCSAHLRLLKKIKKIQQQPRNRAITLCHSIAEPGKIVSPKLSCLSTSDNQRHACAKITSFSHISAPQQTDWKRFRRGTLPIRLERLRTECPPKKSGLQQKAAADPAILHNSRSCPITFDSMINQCTQKACFDAL